jgi:gamma-glutamylcyclotransferase (GGCT)/AIG2-like uncharacterized protein YtfP
MIQENSIFDINSQFMENELSFIPIFVYGTMRYGGTFNHLLKPHIKVQIDNVYCIGDLFSSTQGS